ncbi:hypothetical protein BN871_HM_00250 [Paenibacillus sp. P22]|nr:hypothetical protein BN871_HM_00250 [Paenibacillus sp. P22]
MLQFFIIPDICGCRFNPNAVRPVPTIVHDRPCRGRKELPLIAFVAVRKHRHRSIIDGKDQMAYDTISLGIGKTKQNASSINAAVHVEPSRQLDAGSAGVPASDEQQGAGFIAAAVLHHSQPVGLSRLDLGEGRSFKLLFCGAFALQISPQRRQLIQWELDPASLIGADDLRPARHAVGFAPENAPAPNKQNSQTKQKEKVSSPLHRHPHPHLHLLDQPPSSLSIAVVLHQSISRETSPRRTKLAADPESPDDIPVLLGMRSSLDSAVVQDRPRGSLVGAVADDQHLGDAELGRLLQRQLQQLRRIALATRGRADAVADMTAAGEEKRRQAMTDIDGSEYAFRLIDEPEGRIRHPALRKSDAGAVFFQPFHHSGEIRRFLCDDPGNHVFSALDPFLVEVLIFFFQPQIRNRQPNIPHRSSPSIVCISPQCGQLPFKRNFPIGNESL